MTCCNSSEKIPEVEALSVACAKCALTAASSLRGRGLEDAVVVALLLCLLQAEGQQRNDNRGSNVPSSSRPAGLTGARAPGDVCHDQGLGHQLGQQDGCWRRHCCLCCHSSAAPQPVAETVILVSQQCMEVIIEKQQCVCVTHDQSCPCSLLCHALCSTLLAWQRSPNMSGGFTTWDWGPTVTGYPPVLCKPGLWGQAWGRAEKGC